MSTQGPFNNRPGERERSWNLRDSRTSVRHQRGTRRGTRKATFVFRIRELEVGTELAETGRTKNPKTRTRTARRGNRVG
jgi:hypothetical protein